MEHSTLSQKSAQPHPPTGDAASAASLAQAAAEAAQAAQNGAGASPTGNAPHTGPGASLDAPTGAGDAAHGARPEAITPEVIPPDDATTQAAGNPSEAAHLPLRRPGQTGDYDGQGGHARQPHGDARSGGSFRYYSWGVFRGGSGGSGQGGTTGSGMGGDMGGAFLMSAQAPMLITLALLIGVGASLGVLAAIGFGFFYLLGSAFAATANARRILSGKPLTPATVWLNRLLVWGAALFITVALAQGL